MRTLYVTQDIDKDGNPVVRAWSSRGERFSKEYVVKPTSMKRISHMTYERKYAVSLMEEWPLMTVTIYDY